MFLSLRSQSQSQGSQRSQRFMVSIYDRKDRRTLFSAIAAIVAIIWKPGLKDAHAGVFLSHDDPSIEEEKSNIYYIYCMLHHYKIDVHMLCFKIIFVLKIFKPVRFLFPFVSDYDNEYETKEDKN